MARRKSGSGNEIIDLIGAIIVLLVMLWVFWILFHTQIIAFFTNLLIGLVELIVLALIVLAGGYVAWELEENNNITAGWGIVVGIAIFIILSALRLGTIGAVIVLLDIGALLAFAWKFIDQNQYGIDGGFLGR
jgi:hypothetical protein